MGKPEGSLTGAQFEIMELVWEAEAGLTVTEVWELIRQKRKVSRTTVLNLVDRLEKRGWLKRQKVDGAFRYCATTSREQTEASLASQFVSDYFAGSASDVLLSLIGARRISKKELERLKEMLEGQPESKNRKQNRG